VSSNRTLLQNQQDDHLFGSLLIAEEALDPPFIQQLGRLVQKQPSWSDLPILILTGSGRETVRTSRLEKEWLPLGSPILLERPVRTATLVSSVRAALRARKRQYEIRDALAQLSQERETLQAVLDSLPVGVVLANASGEIILGNQRLEKLVRHPLIRSSGIDTYGEWSAYHPDGRRVRGEEFPLPRAMKEGRPIPSEEYLYERGDGTRGWISLAAAPVLNEQGIVTGGVVTLSDIDQQKRSEMALIQSEKLAAVGRLAASIAHEINNPLESVTNLLYLARQNQDSSAQVKEYLDVAELELARVSHIVSHTLKFHRQSTRPTSLTPAELLAPTLGLYAGRLSGAGIKVSIEHETEETVTCFDGEIRQVLSNLVSNAMDAMRTGGRLRVRSRKSRSWKSGASGVRITIADTGHGMPEDVRKRIYEAFYTTKGNNGTGLGLWISKGIVEKHGGILHVRSTAKTRKAGTTFSLFLPANLP
jgi:signal transduction histidine kinase